LVKAIRLEAFCAAVSQPARHEGGNIRLGQTNVKENGTAKGNRLADPGSGDASGSGIGAMDTV
jgi:hypothetical protein